MAKGRPEKPLAFYLMMMGISQTGTQSRDIKFFLCLSCRHWWQAQGVLSSRTMTPRMINTQSTLNLWDLLLQLDLCGFMGPDWFHPRLLKDLSESLQVLSQWFFNNFGNLERSLLTRSWQTLSQFSRRARKVSLITVACQSHFSVL